MKCVWTSLIAAMICGGFLFHGQSTVVAQQTQSAGSNSSAKTLPPVNIFAQKAKRLAEKEAKQKKAAEQAAAKQKQLGLPSTKASSKPAFGSTFPSTNSLSRPIGTPNTLSGLPNTFGTTNQSRPHSGTKQNSSKPGKSVFPRVASKSSTIPKRLQENVTLEPPKALTEQDLKNTATVPQTTQQLGIISGPMKISDGKTPVQKNSLHGGSDSIQKPVKKVLSAVPKRSSVVPLSEVKPHTASIQESPQPIVFGVGQQQNATKKEASPKPAVNLQQTSKPATPPAQLPLVSKKDLESKKGAQQKPFELPARPSSKLNLGKRKRQAVNLAVFKGQQSTYRIREIGNGVRVVGPFQAGHASAMRAPVPCPTHIVRGQTLPAGMIVPAHKFQVNPYSLNPKILPRPTKKYLPKKPIGKTGSPETRPFPVDSLGR